MTALFKNSIMMVLAAGILLISAGSALAAPGDAYYPGQNLQIDPETAAQLQDMIESGQLQLAAPDEDEDYIVPPDEPADDGQVPEDEDEGVEPGEPGDEPVPGDDEPGFDNPGDSDNPDNPDNPGNPDVSGTPPVTDQPPATTGTPGASSKLPNTGSHLLILAGLGLALAGAAVLARRVVAR
ncbi:MAG: LPXTG cell wall anchor domain-containing protein [Actinobacteria bacterium]|nr:LPXTG cell wall anchor domain-containing protein [Actinomycetota bacterium]